MQERLECEDCDQTFSRAALKFRHVRAVHNMQPFKCDKCDKQYNRRDVLNRHIKITHESEKLKCEECEETFKRSDFLEQFMIVKNINVSNVIRSLIEKTTLRGTLKRLIINAMNVKRGFVPCVI